MDKGFFFKKKKSAHSIILWIRLNFLFMPGALF